MSMDYERRGTLKRKKFEYYRDEITIDFLEINKNMPRNRSKNFLFNRKGIGAERRKKTCPEQNAQGRGIREV